MYAPRKSTIILIRNEILSTVLYRTLYIIATVCLPTGGGFRGGSVVGFFYQKAVTLPS
jgi:hypothetical protein